MKKVGEYNEGMREIYRKECWVNGIELAEKCANIRERLDEVLRGGAGYEEKKAFRKKRRRRKKLRKTGRKGRRSKKKRGGPDYGILGRIVCHNKAYGTLDILSNFQSSPD